MQTQFEFKTNILSIGYSYYKRKASKSLVLHLNLFYNHEIAKLQDKIIIEN